MDGRREEDGCHRLKDTCTQKVQTGGYVHTEGTDWRIRAHRRYRLEDTCIQKRRLENGREGGQGPTRTVEPWSSSSKT